MNIHIPFGLQALYGSNKKYELRNGVSDHCGHVFSDSGLWSRGIVDLQKSGLLRGDEYENVREEENVPMGFDYHCGIYYYVACLLDHKILFYTAGGFV